MKAPSWASPWEAVGTYTSGTDPSNQLPGPKLALVPFSLRPWVSHSVGLFPYLCDENSAHLSAFVGIVWICACETQVYACNKDQLLLLSPPPLLPIGSVLPGYHYHSHLRIVVSLVSYCLECSSWPFCFTWFTFVHLSEMLLVLPYQGESLQLANHATTVIW